MRTRTNQSRHRKPPLAGAFGDASRLAVSFKSSVGRTRLSIHLLRSLDSLPFALLNTHTQIASHPHTETKSQPPHQSITCKMQYPQIQFYRGSLVRLASGKLKQVEELNSDDFLESAPLASEALVQGPTAGSAEQQVRAEQSCRAGDDEIAMELDCDNNHNGNQQTTTSITSQSSYSLISTQPNNQSCDQHKQQQHSDSNNQNQRDDDDDNELDVDVVSPDDLSGGIDLSERPFRTQAEQLRHHLRTQQQQRTSDKLDGCNMQTKQVQQLPTSSTGDADYNDDCGGDEDDDDNNHLYIESSVVRDFLEVGPPGSTSPALSTTSLGQAHSNQFAFTINPSRESASLATSNPFPVSSMSSLASSGSSTTSSSTGSLAAAVSPQPVAAHSSQSSGQLSGQLPARAAHYLSQSHIHSPPLPPLVSTNSTNHPSSSHTQFAGHIIQQHTQNPTVLIKFFLETSRTIAFIEVPIEHPFFVFHRGWSSWNPQRTYDKFGLKCRKLKIGDTCISLVRRQNKHSAPQPQASATTTATTMTTTSRNHLDRQSSGSTSLLKNPTREDQTSYQRRHSHSTNKQHQQESDQCNILFSSIKIRE